MSEMSAGERIFITGTGLVTSVGHDSFMTPAAIRAGISRFAEIPEFATKKGAKAVGSLVSGITDDRSGSDRLLSMAIPAMQEALFNAEEYYEELDLSQGELVLSLGPPERPAYEEFDNEDLQTLLEMTEGEELPSAQIIREGSSGGVLALLRAVTLLREGKAAFCIVGGVDSLIETPALMWLEAAGRLKTDDRPTGCIPGEAAAFMVLELESAARKRDANVLCELVNTAYAMEEGSILSDKPLFGKGLTSAITAVLSKRRIGTDTIDGIICDLNGEHYRMKEWGLVQARLFNGAEPVPELWHPAENIGDVGAASAVVFAAIAASSIRGGYFKGPNLLLWTSSDTGGRGSALLSAAQNRK